jgi:hypothetical protein
MTNWRVSSDDGSTRAWHSSPIELGEYPHSPNSSSNCRIDPTNDHGKFSDRSENLNLSPQPTLPIRPGDKIRDTDAIIWDVTAVKCLAGETFELRMTRDDGDGTAITTLRCSMEFGCEE